MVKVSGHSTQLSNVCQSLCKRELSQLQRIACHRVVPCNGDIDFVLPISSYSGKLLTKSQHSLDCRAYSLLAQGILERNS